MSISFFIILLLMIFMEVPFSLTMLYFLVLIVVFNVFVFGICSILAHYGIFVDDLSNIFNIILRFLFYLSGIFYNIIGRVPEPYGNYILKLNPIAYLLSEFRNVILYNKSPDFKYLLIWFAVGMILSIVGLKNIYRNENSYAKVL